MSQTVKVNSPNAITLMLKFTAIAREQDKAKLQMLLAQIERDYAEYVETVWQFVDSQPAVVVEQLCTQFPALNGVILMPGVADKALSVVEKIQQYLKEKGKQNVD